MPTVNIRAFSHKKSTVIENGGPKLPTAAQLELGEIAINFAKGYETLSIKNNNNEIVTFTNDNYWINKELAIAAALNDLNDRKQDALEMDEVPTEGSENVVTSGGLYSYITEIEQVTAAALNDLNDRITSLALSDDYAAAAQGTPPLAGDTYETAISKLHKVILDDELITSSALNDLNDRIDNLSLSEDYEAADPTSEPAGGDTYEEAISKLHGAILENELATAGALNDLNTRISNIVVPELILSEDYEPSSLDNEDLFLEPGDSYETAFAKLEKAINDNENITSAALTDLDSRLNLLHLPQSLDDIPDGSTRKLSDYATITSVNSSLATKQDTLVSGTNIKTINNESILGSGNITIQGGSSATNEGLGNGYAIQTDNGQSQTVTASLSNYVLTTNGRVSVKFTHDAPYSPSLNINNTGAKVIRDKNNMPLTYDAIYEGDIATFIYDGQYYILVDVKHEYNYESYLSPDPLRMTLTQDENESNIQICSFTRDGKTFGSIIFSQLDKILYLDITFTNPYVVSELPGLQEWIFSAIANSPSGDPVILLLRIFNQWDPTYMGGEERIYVDTNVSGLDIIEVVNLGGAGGPIVDITQYASSAQDLSSFLYDLPTGYYKNNDGMVMPEDIFYKDGSGKIIFIPSGLEYSYDYNYGYDFMRLAGPTNHPMLIAIPTYEQYAEDDTSEQYPNYGLEKTLLNLDFLELPGADGMFVPYIPAVGSTYTMLIGVITLENDFNKITDVCVLEIKTTGTQLNFMYLNDYLIQVTEYLLNEGTKRTINTVWTTTGDINYLDFRNVAWTNGQYFAFGSNLINGIPLSTNKGYYYGESSTAAATVQKEVSIPSITELNVGQVIIVKPTITSTVASSTLKLNDFAAYPMRYNNAAITTSTDSVVWNSEFPSWWLFDGTYWVFVGHGLDSNTTYSGMTQAEITAGTSTTNRLISPKLLRDNFYTETEVDNLIGAITPGDVNVIETVKVNGTALTPDSNKAVDITIPTKTSDLTNDSGFLTSYTETDPTVPAWAKAANKPSYTAQEVGALPNTYTPPVTSVNGQTGAVNLTIPSAPGTLNTTATTAQSTSSSEALSGNITLHKVAKTGTYNDLIGKPTIPTVNNATLTIQKNGTTVNTFTANASSNVTANIQVNELPTVSSSDNGKVLQVVNGAWSLVMPTAIYSGTSTPNNNVGNDGDLYLQTS